MRRWFDVKKQRVIAGRRFAKAIRHRTATSFRWSIYLHFAKAIGHRRTKFFRRSVFIVGRFCFDMRRGFDVVMRGASAGWITSICEGSLTSQCELISLTDLTVKSTSKCEVDLTSHCDEFSKVVFVFDVRQRFDIEIRNVFTGRRYYFKMRRRLDGVMQNIYPPNLLFSAKSVEKVQ